MIDLTKNQCRDLADFIEYNIFYVIRDDTGIDNIGWLIDIVDAYKKLRAEGEKNDEEDSESIGNYVHGGSNHVCL